MIIGGNLKVNNYNSPNHLYDYLYVSGYIS